MSSPLEAQLIYFAISQYFCCIFHATILTIYWKKWKLLLIYRKVSFCKVHCLLIKNRFLRTLSLKLMNIVDKSEDKSVSTRSDKKISIFETIWIFNWKNFWFQTNVKWVSKNFFWTFSLISRNIHIYN